MESEAFSIHITLTANTRNLMMEILFKGWCSCIIFCLTLCHDNIWKSGITMSASCSRVKWRRTASIRFRLPSAQTPFLIKRNFQTFPNTSKKNLLKNVDQACSTSYVMWATLAKFYLPMGNLKFNTKNE